MANIMTLQVIDNLLSHRQMLDEFYDQCKSFGYNNNISDEKMKFDFVRERFGNIWAVVKDKKIIGVAGCHEFPEIDSNGFRIQFRGCELPGSDIKKGLAKSHMNSFTWRELIPYEIEWCNKLGSSNLYITTNYNHDESGRMILNHRAMVLMEKQGYLKHHIDKNIFGVDQTVWRFNSEKYLETRRRLPCYTLEPPPLG